MTEAVSYLGIRYPERAEGVGSYSEYKVFVDFWRPLTEILAEHYRRLAVRRETRILGIFGPQGAGKTLFSRQLISDFKESKSRLPNTFPLDNQSVWHSITGGTPSNSRLVFQATSESDLIEIENNEEWVKTLLAWVQPVERRCIAIADNAEGFYFLKGLVGDKIQLTDRRDPALLALAAERLVQLARTELSGVMLILLSNDLGHLEALRENLESQHRGLTQVAEIPLPNSTEKERAVRVNIIA